MVASLAEKNGAETPVEKASAGPVFMDHGEHMFRYRLLMGAGAWDACAIARRACEHAFPVACFPISQRNGAFPKRASLASVKSENVLLTAAKLAEDQRGWILRFRETCGRQGEAQVYLSGFREPISVEVNAHELKTVRLLERGEELVIEETNLIEESLPHGEDA